MTNVLGVPQISQTLLADIDRVGRKYPRWTREAYFELDGAYLVEYRKGRLEILPMPSMTHQRIAARLYSALRAAAPAEAEVLFAGTRVRVSEDTFREPDVLYVQPGGASSDEDEFTEHAALVIEVLSESNRDHDLDTKRREYAQAGIPEYWIVDPENRRITVLQLRGDHCEVHGDYAPGQVAQSLLLPRFSPEVAKVFGAD
jgi:Uma2 family endonuclease